MKVKVTDSVVDFPIYAEDRRHFNMGRPRKIPEDWTPRGVRFPPELARRITADAAQSHRTFSDQVRYLVEKGLAPDQGMSDRLLISRLLKFGRGKSDKDSRNST